MKNLNVVFVVGDKTQNELMDHFDLKGPLKMFGQSISFSLTLEDNADEDKVVEYLLNTAKKEYLVGAIIIPNKKIAFKDENLKILSNGKQIFSFDDVVYKALGNVVQ